MIVFKYQPTQAKIFPVSKKHTVCKESFEHQNKIVFHSYSNSVESFIEKKKSMCNLLQKQIKKSKKSFLCFYP